ncbi:MAG: hypothetical protein AAFN16_02020, partial [Pseudomonadota bacterium]
MATWLFRLTGIHLKKDFGPVLRKTMRDKGDHTAERVQGPAATDARDPQEAGDSLPPEARPPRGGNQTNQHHQGGLNRPFLCLKRTEMDQAQRDTETEARWPTAEQRQHVFAALCRHIAAGFSLESFPEADRKTIRYYAEQFP